MYKKNNYSEKLKDPRWQKKRLEIFNRDEFACSVCFDTESTLCVHHKHYIKNLEPWEYPNELLTTLCSSCHEYETENMSLAENKLIQALKEKFFSFEIEELASSVKRMDMVHVHDVVASLLCWILINKELKIELLDRFLRV